MECDLQRVLASDELLSVDQVQVLLKQLLLGVQAMHHHGIIRACMRVCLKMLKFCFSIIVRFYTCARLVFIASAAIFARFVFSQVIKTSVHTYS